MSIDKQQVSNIIEAIGGKENIYAATHCVTRLRFALADEAKVDKEKLESLDLVKGSFSTNGQFQVVIGPGTVEKVYKELINQTGASEGSKDDVKKASEQNLNPLQRAVKMLADIFIPILPAIVTAGLLMGINNVLTGEGIFFEQSVVQAFPQWADFASIINLIANTAFTFLPGLIGWSAMTRFGGSPLLGIVLGLMLVHPDLLNAWGYGKAEEIPTWNIFGLEVEKVGYQGQVLPVLLASYVLAKLEIFLRNRIPDSFQMLFVAPIALLVTGFVSFIAIGPITFFIGNMITDGVVAIFDFAPILGGLIYGGLYAPLVITGMHHTFLAVDLQLIGSTGGTFLWPMVALSNIAQGSAALAMLFILKDEKLKSLSVTSAISAYLGVTEPALFGVNLRFRFAFISAIIGSAIAGAFISIQAVKAPSIGVGGLPGFLSIFPNNWGAFFIGMAIVIIVPFLLTILFAKVRKAQ
ncbi:PTS system trehalose-specific transporter subunit IIBC [Niallia circulans]|uniref:protein-N(pi)-phosphohistidine--sucrose phosphotransferase n=1 Tax=Niallia circulans TaxID=1397 RepID=A0A0J1I7V0_NIACI|nr:PTS system trehalose-specific EIIBC component [Niallia circulans]KLV22024.1 trehalose permease IIC protein [Niallia circulans]MDR4316465.1 PTS trehalose transporter subunit IIBC [Niallia circulans]MED3838362.1 PTS system trehalose-specific EIIBC component [Niallia circulans]MED4243837.1 PTS system trehalose-specific EIIBC component [Niallia circulans]MED4246229.1 PTS system trehalose-specific EIIBC component [Niallia circulans]